MIIGIGHDLVEMERIAGIMNSGLRERFVRRVLTDAEQVRERALGVNSMEFVAGRFAAKEAVVKALGCGIGAVVGFQDITIMPVPECTDTSAHSPAHRAAASGKPQCILSAAAWERLGHNPSVLQIHVTITHERKLASAFAIIERV
ncbi:holo-[acyl-carrier-protein] synthase [Paenibacillaceae bacterium]|nr:holo-[acyl-carrier-protein] synthase [Paenibacillaceae bacterium]